jgi:hypothetical protein
VPTRYRGGREFSQQTTAEIGSARRRFGGGQFAQARLRVRNCQVPQGEGTVAYLNFTGIFEADLSFFLQVVSQGGPITDGA